MNRIEALQEINRVEEIHCKPCPVTYAKDCAGCQHSMTLKRLGGVLLRSTNEYRANKNRESVEMTSKLNGLTVDQYKMLKGEGMTDKEIREQYDITAGHFSQFKNKNKLVGEFNSHSHNKKTDQRETKSEDQSKDYAELYEKYKHELNKNEQLSKEIELCENYNVQLKQEKKNLEIKLDERGKELELNESMNQENVKLNEVNKELEATVERQKRTIGHLNEEKESLKDQCDNTFIKTELQAEEIDYLKRQLEKLASYERVVAELELFKDAWYNGLNKQ